MLKKGDRVVMHTCGEAEFHKGQVWNCETDEFPHTSGDYGLVFLEGFSGSFMTKYLERTN